MREDHNLLRLPPLFHQWITSRTLYVQPIQIFVAFFHFVLYVLDHVGELMKEKAWNVKLQVVVGRYYDVVVV